MSDRNYDFVRNPLDELVSADHRIEDLEDELDKARAENDLLRLTDAERSDLTIAANAYAGNDDDPDCERIATTLRGLLERHAK